MEKPLKIILLILTLILYKENAIAQLPSDITFITGLTATETNFENYTWQKCLKDYPEFGFNSDQFILYNTNGTPSSFEGGQVFLNSISIELGKGMSHSKINFLNRSSHRFRFTADGSTFYNNNMEYNETIGTSSNSNPVVQRDYYEIFMNGTFLYFTYGIHHFSNYKGKLDNIRLWIGLSTNQGIVLSNIFLEHTFGIYEMSANDGGGYNYFPYGFSVPEKTENDFKETRWMNGFSIPFGIEWKIGKRKRSALGMQYTFGNSWLISFGKNTMSTSVFSGGINFRYELGT